MKIDWMGQGFALVFMRALATCCVWVLCSTGIQAQSTQPSVGTKPGVAAGLIAPDLHKHSIKKGSQPPMVVFSNPYEANGQLLVYWDLEFQPVTNKEPTLNNLKIKRRLLMRFYPDTASQSSLPRFADSANSVTLRLFFYSGAVGASANDFDLLDKRTANSATAGLLKTLPKSFLEERIGHTTVSARLKVDGVVSTFEGDHRFFFARPAAFTRLSDSAELLPAVRSEISGEGFMSQPWVKSFQVKQAVSARTQPDTKAVEGFTISEEDKVDLLSFPKPGWAAVRVDHGSSKQPSPVGYLPSRLLWLVN